MLFFNKRFMIWSTVATVAVYLVWDIIKALPAVVHFVEHFWFVIVPAVALVVWFVVRMVQDSRRKLGLGQRDQRRSYKDYPRI